MSLFIVGLDGTLVNIDLPSLRADLDASVSGLQWVLEAAEPAGLLERPGQDGPAEAGSDGDR